MKKNLLLLCSLFMGLIIAISCDSDDNDKISELEKNYFTIEDAVYRTGNIPEATTTSRIQGLSINNRALSGGMNFITIVSPTTYNRFFVAAKNVDGYWEYRPMTTRANTSGEYVTYTIPVMYSTDYNSNIVMLISGETEDGDITEPYEAQITYVDSESGDLNINLTFSNAKDVDLHLYTPSGEHIYYNNRGGSVQTNEGNTVSYGLDHDSNADCDLDYLNNENIYIPAELIESGTYRVIVDMYRNCDRSVATSWSVVARYRGNVVRVATGANPASGVYPVGAGNDDMTEVMTFTISGTRAGGPAIVPGSFKPVPQSDRDLMKYEDLLYRRSQR